MILVFFFFKVNEGCGGGKCCVLAEALTIIKVSIKLSIGRILLEQISIILALFSRLFHVTTYKVCKKYLYKMYFGVISFVISVSQIPTCLAQIRYLINIC